MLAGETLADESPLEPGVYLVPAGAVLVAPPPSWPDDKWPRWNGSVWSLVTKLQPAKYNDPAAKLREFLAANPDVAELIGTSQGGV